MSVPVPKTAFPHPPEIVKTTSFPSSYLDGAEETFVLKLGVSGQHHHVFQHGKNTTDDSEIDVFDAEKYFNEELNRVPKVDPKKLSSDHRQDEKKDEPHEPVVPKVSTLRSTRSESSSTNSRSALLHNNSRKLQPRKSLIRKGFLASIGCNCSCVDKNSLEIDDYADQSSLDKTPGNHQAVEVISVSPILEKNRKNSLTTLEKKLNVMSWDAIALSPAEDIKLPPISSDNINDDGDSDGSSDLFEIESISKGKPFLSRQASGRTTCYAPSEASIEWSVITASAADFSVVSDSEEFRFTSTDKTTPRKLEQINSKMITSFREIPKLRPGILSGCKSQKAVRIAGDAHRTNQPGNSNARRHLTTISPCFRDESNKLGGFSAKIRPQLFDTARVLVPQSRSANAAAHLLYT